MAKGKRSQATYRDFQEACAQLDAGLPAVIVLEGEEPYLRTEGLRRILQVAKAQHPHADVVQYQGPGAANESGSLSPVLEELTSSSLFASEKIVVLKQADHLLFGGSGETTGKQKPASHMLAEWVASPADGMRLVLEVRKLQRNRIIGKALAKTLIVPCPAMTRSGDVAAWLVAKARELKKSLGHGVADMLITTHGTQLSVLASELEKIIIYIGDHDTIEQKDAEAFFAGSVEFNAFGLTNAIEARDLTNALTFARLIADLGSRDASGKRSDATSSMHRSLAMIASMMEQILQCRALLSSNLSPREVAAEVGLSPWRAESLSKAAARFSIQDLRYALNTIADAIHATHDTGGDPQMALERICVACCQGVPTSPYTMKGS